MGFIIKKSQDVKPAKKKSRIVVSEKNVKGLENKVTTYVDGSKKKINNVMDTKSKLDMAESVISDAPKAIKRIKKDKGLIERTESSKTILTEDNKELLVD